jgi:Pentapeptide repeats (8 copies)
LAGVLLLWLVPLLLTDIRGLSAVEQLKARNDVRTSLVAFAVAVGSAGALWFTYRSYRLQKDQNATDRYSHAVDQLGHDRPEVRLGGIYALERLAQDSSVDYRTVVFVLGAFVRQFGRSATPDTRVPQEDVVAAIRVAARLVRAACDRDELGDTQLDLRRAHLDGLQADWIDLSYTMLCGAHLNGASLRASKLEQVDLTNAHLAHADLTDATLIDVDLTGAILSKAKVGGAQMRGVKGMTREQLASATVDDTTPPPNVS